MKTHRSEDIIAAVYQAGVIGAGGGGFPTHAKLKAQVDTIVVNGSECEPLLKSDKAMMLQKADQLIMGLHFSMQATGAKRGIIGVKSHYADVVEALEKALPDDKSITLLLLDNYYPAGDEFILVYEATGRIIPEGGIPLHVGVVVHNAISLIQIHDAMNGKPVTERAVTIAGEVKNPQIITVPIGTSYRTLIELAGGVTTENPVLIDGGPMMGRMVDDWNNGINKTTSGVLVLPDDHFVIRQAKKPLEQVMKQAHSACCQCFRCTDLCPRNLLGHAIYPHKTMRSISYREAEQSENITSAFLCSQCGMCELIACDFMRLSPRRIYAAYRKALVEKGIKNPHNKKIEQVQSSFIDRKVSIPMMLRKLDLLKYNVAIPDKGSKIVKQVRVHLNKHIGMPAKPIVRVNQSVHRCEAIAKTPDGQLGAIYHAPIDGMVTRIDEHIIEITQ